MMCVPEAGTRMQPRAGKETNAGTPLVSEDPSRTGPVCANCGAAVTRGAYCSACGQRIRNHSLSMKEFLGEAAEVLTHADSRLWRTFVPLILRPGFLTQEFLRGRRTSYLPPVRLYLVLSVLFFLVISLTAKVPTITGMSPDTASKALAEVQKDLSESTDPEEQALSRKLQGLDALNDRLAAAAGSGGSASCGQLVATTPASGRLRQELVAVCEKVKADNGQELMHSLIHNLGRAMFVFLPLLAALMTLLYLPKKRYYVEHLLLLVHNHAFVFLVMSVLLIATRFIASDRLADWLSTALSIYVIYYVYESMRRVYVEGRGLTILKFATLAFGYFVCGLFTLAGAVVYSAMTL
jgi:hypothetical protein